MDRTKAINVMKVSVAGNDFSIKVNKIHSLISLTAYFKLEVIGTNFKENTGNAMCHVHFTVQ